MAPGTCRRHPAGPDLRPSAAVRFLTGAALVLATVALAVWLWNLACRFPAMVWNDLRLAPSVALAQGWPIYPSATEGVVNTWTYGPLPVLLFWPVSWASSAFGALQIGAGLNLAFTLGAIGFVCFRWPVPEGSITGREARFVAFLLCVAMWPEAPLLYYVSDNIAVACGLVGTTLLAQRRDSFGLWAAAGFTAAAVACKQTAVGLAAGHLLCLALTGGRAAVVGYAWRCVAVGLAMAAVAAWAFGPFALWFTLVELPAHFGWTPDPWGRLLDQAPQAAGQILAPALVLVVFRRSLLRGTALLAACVWLCTLPLGLAALFKTGGRMNSVHSFLLWLPPVVTLAVTTTRGAGPHLPGRTIAAGLAAAFACGQLAFAAEIRLWPRREFYREADSIAARLPNQVWFPMHPLANLYRDHRYYHDEDGIYVRALTKMPLGRQHLLNHLPRDLRVIALPTNATSWGMARKLLPPGAEQFEIGSWTLWHLPSGAPP